MKSEKGRKQRKAQKNANNHTRRKMMSATLAGNLRKKYGVKSFPVREGDEVEIMRGGFAGTINKVAKVDRRKQRIFIENVTVKKADESQEPYGIHPSNVRILNLELSDAWRKRKLEEER